MFTKPHVVIFSFSHLVAGGWYLDCSDGFVTVNEQSLYNVIINGDSDEVVHV